MDKKDVEGTYTVAVDCKDCGFSDIIQISRKVAVQNAECPECGEAELVRDGL